MQNRQCVIREESAFGNTHCLFSTLEWIARATGRKWRLGPDNRLYVDIPEAIRTAQPGKRELGRSLSED
jgi:hypothetical protein